jgi:hypothetical protein
MPRPKARLRGHTRSPKPSLIIEPDVVLFERRDGEMSGAAGADATHVQLDPAAKVSGVPLGRSRGPDIRGVHGGAWPTGMMLSEL